MLSTFITILVPCEHFNHFHVLYSVVFLYGDMKNVSNEVVRLVDILCVSDMDTASMHHSGHEVYCQPSGSCHEESFPLLCVVVVDLKNVLIFRSMSCTNDNYS